MSISTYPTQTITVMTRSTIRDEVAELARTNQPLPSSYRMPARILYRELRAIYRDYAANVLSLEQAKHEKSKALKDYDSMALDEEIYYDNARRMSEILRVLSKAEKCGCEYCKEIARLFDGRQWRTRF